MRTTHKNLQWTFCCGTGKGFGTTIAYNSILGSPVFGFGVSKIAPDQLWHVFLN